MKILQYRARPATEPGEYPQVWWVRFRHWGRTYEITTTAANPSENSHWYYCDNGGLVVDLEVKGLIRSIYLKQFVKAASEKSEVHNP